MRCSDLKRKSDEASFTIPHDAKGTDTRRSLPIRWQLMVSMPTAGPDFETTFPVPIYARV